MRRDTEDQNSKPARRLYLYIILGTLFDPHRFHHGLHESYFYMIGLLMNQELIVAVLLDVF